MRAHATAARGSPGRGPDPALALDAGPHRAADSAEPREPASRRRVDLFFSRLRSAESMGTAGVTAAAAARCFFRARRSSNTASMSAAAAGAACERAPAPAAAETKGPRSRRFGGLGSPFIPTGIAAATAQIAASPRRYTWGPFALAADMAAHRDDQMHSRIRSIIACAVTPPSCLSRRRLALSESQGGPFRQLMAR